MITDSEIARLLELHAALLATDGALAAQALAHAADGEVAALMDTAARLFTALPPVTPDPTFRANLERRLEHAAARAAAPLAPRWRQLLRRHHTVVAFASGAALAAVGLSLAHRSERLIRT